MTLAEREAREEIVAACRSAFARRLTPGCTGNVSMRVDSGILVTPTGCSFGSLRAEDLSLVTPGGELVTGPAPTKELGLHLALYAAGHGDAVAHLHSPHAVAYSCLPRLTIERPIPFLTPYLVMRAGDLRLVPYHRPGSRELLAAVEKAGRMSAALLLARHGTLVAASGLRSAMDALEEVEQAAGIALLVGARGVPLSEARVRELRGS